jgi:hypothetical protein
MAKKDILEIAKYIRQSVENIKSYLNQDGSVSCTSYHKINDSFNAKCVDNKLIISYEVETVSPLRGKINDLPKVEEKFKDILDKIKSEVKNISDKSVSFSKVGNMTEKVYTLSFSRQLKIYVCVYEISGTESNAEIAEKEVEKARVEMSNSLKYNKK